MKRVALGLFVASALVASTTTARAQDTQAGAGASAGTAAAPAASASVTPAPATPPPPPPPAPAAAADKGDKDKDDETIDHEKVVGHFAVGFMGVSQLPIGSLGGAGGGGGGATVTRDNLNAPTIGVRYWLNRKIGIDAGLGLAWTGGVNSVNANGTDVPTADPATRMGGALHFGVPIAFSSGKHYTFEAIPEANVGLTNGSTKLGNADITLSGFRLDAGGRVGAEIYFGFIGVPQLSLQGSVGLNFRYESAKVSSSVNGQNSSASIVTRTLGTTVQSDPWALFVNNISAFYYF